MRAALYVTYEPASGSSTLVVGPFAEADRTRAQGIADGLYDGLLAEPDSDGFASYGVTEVSVPDGCTFEPGRDNTRYGLPSVACLPPPALADAPRFAVAEAHGGWSWVRVFTEDNPDEPDFDDYRWKILTWGGSRYDYPGGDNGPDWWTTKALADLDAAITHLPQAVAR